MNLSLLDCIMGQIGHGNSREISESILSSSAAEGLLPSEQPMSRLGSMAASKSIPISNIKRTPSEVQLHEDEAMADYRDYCFYARLVNGINNRRECSNDSFRLSTDQSLANIIRTRSLPIVEDSDPDRKTRRRDRKQPSTDLKHQPSSYWRSGLGMEVDDDRDDGVFFLEL